MLVATSLTVTTTTIPRHYPVSPGGKKITPIWEPLAYGMKYQVCVGFPEQWSVAEIYTAPPEPEPWVALVIQTNLPMSCQVIGPDNYKSQTRKKNSSLFWSWHIQTNPAKWFKHDLVVGAQFRGNMQGSTRRLSFVRAWSHLSHKNQTTNNPLKKKKLKIKPF